MSRSYKKTPYCGQRKNKFAKRQASKVVRRTLKHNPEIEFAPGGYKKLYSSYDICDYWWVRSWNNYWLDELESYVAGLSRPWHRNDAPPNKQECYRRWLKYYKCK